MFDHWWYIGILHFIHLYSIGGGCDDILICSKNFQQWNLLSECNEKQTWLTTSSWYESLLSSSWTLI